MCTAPIRVAPDTKYIAEVVVLVTTLGAKRTEFNAGKRVRDLFEIKGVHHKIVDFNRDARQAGSGEAENKAIQKLMVEGKLQTSDNKDLVLPQIFIDGQYVGNAAECQGLEDDRLLDNILLRRACMKCSNQKRTPEQLQCPNCHEKFDEILPGMMTIEQKLSELAMAEDEFEDFDDEDYDGYDEEGNDTIYPATFTSAASDGTVYPAGYSAAQAPATVKPAVPAQSAARSAMSSAAFSVGDKVQYWSDSKERWVDSLVEGVRNSQKDGKLVYDLNCKKGASTDKVRGYDDAPGT